MTLGSLVHALCFTPDALETEYAVSPFDSFRTNEAKTWKADMELAGRKVITQDQHEEATDIADCVMNTDLLFRFGERDYEVQVEAEMLGVTVKGMIDIAPKHTRSKWGRCPSSPLQTCSSRTDPKTPNKPTTKQ
jgi:hypothetical protein